MISHNCGQQADQLINESLDSTRRMRLMSQHAKEAGMEILINLDDQGDKLDQAELLSGRIHSDIQDTHKHLRKMGSMGPCGCPVLTCMRSFDEFEDFEVYKKSEKNKEVKKKESVQLSTRIGYPVGGFSVEGQKSGFIKRIADDYREDEMEENLCDVSQIMSTMKHIALDIGEELDQQNTQLQRLAEQTDLNLGLVKSSDNYARRLSVAKF